MANVLALALKINADSTGLTNNLGPAERAFQRLGEQASQITGLFDEFTESSEAAAAAQEQTRVALDELLAGVQRGEVTAAQFAQQFAAIGVAARDEADALREAARITEANLSPLERFTREQGRLQSQLDAGRISQETFNRAIASAAKPLSDAERAAVGFVDAANDIEGATEGFGDFGKLVVSLPGPLGSLSGKINEFAGVGRQLSAVFSGGLSAGLSQLGTAALGLVNPFTLAAAGVVAFTQAAQAITSGLIDLENRVEALGNQAFQLGVSFEFVQVLDESARRSGTSVDALRGATTRLQQQLVEAGNGSATATAAIEGLGVSVEELQSLSADEQFRAIGRAITEIQDPAERTAAATRLFGEAGVQLLPFFRNLGPAADDIERFGRVVTDLDRENIDEFGRSVDQLVVATQGLGTTLLLPFVELADGLAVAFTEVTAAITDVIDPIGQLLAPAFAQIGDIVEVVGAGIAAAIRIFGRLAEVIAPIGEFLLPAIVAQLVAINRAAIAGAVTSIARGFIAAGGAAITYATGAGTATAATLTLGAAIRTLLASTGIGALVVGAGLAANALFGWFSSADDAAEGMDKVEGSSANAADEAERLAEALAQEDAALLESAAKAVDDVRGKLSQAIDASAEFGQAGFDAAVQYQTAIADLEKQLDRGIINEEVFRRQAEQARQAYDEQIAIAKQAAAEIEANTKRVDSLLAKANEIPRVEQELNAVQAEIDRVEAELASARESGATAQADALTGRLAQLDQLQATLQDQADEAAQGFSGGFDKAFESVDRGINSLIDKASEFGNAGAEAAVALQDGIEAAQQQVRDGILTKEAFDAEVARQKELFNERVSQLQQAERIAEQIADKEAGLLDRQFEIELARAEELANVRSGSIEINDLREGGISAFFDTLQEDPAIAEAKKQTAELEKVRREIAKLNAERVEILEGTG